MRKSFLFLLLIPFLVSGCFKFGKDYQPPQLNFDIPGVYQHMPENSDDNLYKEDRWWEVFRDTELDQLVDLVLKNNLDIQKAVSRVLEVRSQFRMTRADRFPEFNLRSNGQRQKQNYTNPVSGVSDSQTSDYYTLSLPATFEWDLWGRLARAEEAARAELLYAQENRLVVSQTIIAEAIGCYFEIKSWAFRIEILKKTIKSYKQSLHLVKRRYNHGMVSVLDVRQARRMLAQAEAQLPVMRKHLGLAQHKQAILLGLYPNNSLPDSDVPEYYHDLAMVPRALPAELLYRRPDIRAAEARLKALHARVGVAFASRFPRITLTGSLGYASDELGNLLDPKSEVWNLAFGIGQPLFEAGRLKANQKMMEARYAGGIADYAICILKAFSEVEGTLFIREQELSHRERILAFLEEARAAQKVAEVRYQSGLVGYLAVLDASQACFKAEEQLVLVNLTIFLNRINLHRALGGGWGKKAQSDFLPDYLRIEKKLP